MLARIPSKMFLDLSSKLSASHSQPIINQPFELLEADFRQAQPEKLMQNTGGLGVSTQMVDLFSVLTEISRKRSPYEDQFQA